MAVFIGGIGNSNGKKIVEISPKDIPNRGGGLWNAPYRSYEEGSKSEKRYIIYRKLNNKWSRVGSTIANNYKGVVHFIREVLINEGEYLFNTGETSKTDYLYFWGNTYF